MVGEDILEADIGVRHTSGVLGIKDLDELGGCVAHCVEYFHSVLSGGGRVCNFESQSRRKFRGGHEDV